MKLQMKILRQTIHCQQVQDLLTELNCPDADLPLLGLNTDSNTAANPNPNTKTCINENTDTNTKTNN